MTNIDFDSKNENLEWLKTQVDRLNHLSKKDELSRQDREAVDAGRYALKTLVFHAEAELKA